MPAITISKLSAETRRALEARATRHGVSVEAEVRSILEQVLLPPKQIRLGSLLTSIAEASGRAEFDSERDLAPYESVDLINP